jgi:hypothetical protein
MHPSLSTIAYMPFHDLFANNFILVQPTNLIIYPMWMGRAKNDVVKDFKNENYKKIYVQWWVLVRKGVNNDEEFYHNSLLGILSFATSHYATGMQLIVVCNYLGHSCNYKFGIV